MDTPLSYVELSEAAVAHNMAFFRGVAKAGTRFAVAVKGNAYGHGLREMVSLFESHADFFLVNSIEELRTLRGVSKKPTFVFGYVAPGFLPEAIGLGCIFGVFSLTQFLAIEAAAQSRGVVQDVHIAADAMLGREGFLEGELAALFAAAKSAAHVRITGMYAHFANIEDTSDFSHAQKQIDAYARMQKAFVEAGYSNLETHISATSGLLVYEKDQGFNSIIRIGIGAYGLWPSETLRRQYAKRDIELKPVLSWKTRVAEVKMLAPGSTVGYGLTYKAQKETVAALIPQGYADGYVRALSNCGMVLIGGRRCPVIGRVSMNMFVVDATNAPEVSEGDEVVLIGEQGDKSISAQEIAERSDTINYEATTRISALLPRIVR
jgi:alanine racemase